ncbi:MAG: hypothetical protein U0935_21695 [Pirellulales bacterium]
MPTAAPPSPSPPSRRRSWKTWALRLGLLAGGGYLVWLAVCWGLWSRHYGAAERALQLRDFPAAEQHLEWCRWARPQHPDSWLLSAQAARRAGRFDEWAARLRRADRAGARLPDVRLERLLGTAQQGLTPELEELLQAQLAATRSQFPLVAEVLTAEYMRVYRLPDARAVLNRWVELDGNHDVEPWVRRAWVAEHQLDFDAAVDDYRRVLTMEPDRDPVRLRIAEILFKIRKVDDAVRELEILLVRQPGDFIGVLTLSRCRREQGEFVRATTALDQLPADRQTDPKVRAERGLIALGENRDEDAERWLKEALRDLPREREVLYGLQQALSRLNKTAEADQVQSILKQVDIDGRRMGELVSALAREPGNAELRFEGAMIFLRNGVTDDGVRWLHMTLDANPAHRPAHTQLAEYYERIGQTQRAATHRAVLARLDALPPAAPTSPAPTGPPPP